MEWAQAGVFEAFWREGLLAYDEVQAIDWTWLSVDGAMTKAALGGEKTGPNPTDRGKRGTKRSIVTDGRGIPLGLAVAGANVNDHLLLEQALASLVVERPPPATRAEQHLCLDKGYDCAVVDALVAEQHFTPHIRRRGETPRALPSDGDKKPRRWVVERVHACLNRFRRVLVRWEKRADTYTAMLQSACAVTAWENASLPGEVL